MTVVDDVSCVGVSKHQRNINDVAVAVCFSHSDVLAIRQFVFRFEKPSSAFYQAGYRQDSHRNPFSTKSSLPPNHLVSTQALPPSLAAGETCGFPTEQ